MKGGRIHWEVASTCRSQKEQAGGEGSKGRVLEGRDSALCLGQEVLHK